MDALDTLLRPAAGLLNRSIREVTPARELAADLDGTLAAVRVRDTALAVYLRVQDGEVHLASNAADDPDVIICGSLLALASLARTGDAAALRDGSVEFTGDVRKAENLQRLLKYAKPDFEEELAGVLGDTAAHGIGEFARAVQRWAVDARTTMGDNLREYLQEESRDVPSRYEVDRFAKRVATLRDDVDRLAARISRIERSRD